MKQKTTVSIDEFEPFLEDGEELGQVHWLSSGQDTPLISGIWRALPGEVPEAFDYDYPMHETIHVLEGKVTIDFADGESVTLVAGDLSAVQQGTKSVWRIDPTTPFRKFFVCQ